MTKDTASELKSLATASGCSSASRSVLGTVEELLAQPGVVLTSETVGQRCLKCGQTSATELRHRRTRCGENVQRDEMVLTIRGKKQSLWPAGDQDGNVLDFFVQSRRNKNAATRFFGNLLTGLKSVPGVIITA